MGARVSYPSDTPQPALPSLLVKLIEPVRRVPFPTPIGENQKARSTHKAIGVGQAHNSSQKEHTSYSA